MQRTTAGSLDPIQLLRSLLARKSRAQAGNPLSSVGDGSMQTMDGSMPTADQVFNPSRLLSRGTPSVGPQQQMNPEAAAPPPEHFTPTVNRGPQVKQVPEASPVGTSIPIQPRAVQTEPVTAFQDRLSGVQEAISSGTFDPTGGNSTTFAPGYTGSGSTPIQRFLHASGADPAHFSPAFEEDMRAINAVSKRVNPERFGKMVEASPLSENVEDRRGERTWMNTPMEKWTPQMKDEFGQQPAEDQIAHLVSIINGQEGFVADEYKPAATRQEAQQ